MDDVIEFFGDEMPAMNGSRFMLGDLLVHTWDLARATGHDERLHPEACAMVLANLEPIDEFLRTSGMYGPKLEPPNGSRHARKALGLFPLSDPRSQRLAAIDGLDDEALWEPDASVGLELPRSHQSPDT
jgi:hypothetical protein